MTTISMLGVSKLYPGNITALHPTDLTIEHGEFVTVVGPSGSGKSTLIRLIAGLDKPTSGTIMFGEQIVNRVAPPGRGVGLVVTQGALYDHLTVDGNLRFPLMTGGVTEPESSERVEASAKRFGIRKLLARKPPTLSSGERQLVAAGRAAVRDTRVLLFDEAVAGVDPRKRRQFREHLRTLNDGTRTIVYATNEQDVAMSLGDRMVVLDAGVIEQVGRPIEVYTAPINTFVAQFLGSPGMNIVAGQISGDGTVLIGDDELRATDAPTGVTDVLVGIRPEGVQLASGSAPFERCLHARVTGVEERGSDRMAHVAFGSPDSGAVDFAVRLSSDRPVMAGDRVELDVDLAAIRFFDFNTGVRLG